MASYPNADLRAELNAHGYRLTPQRQKILDIFCTLPQGRHLSAEDLHSALTQTGERIGLSTVYRTIHLMVYMGMLRELELAEGHKHYELNRPLRDHHHHLVCVYCNQTLEFSEDQVDQVGEKQAKSVGYYILDCQLTLYGICPNCDVQKPVL
ncbi:Fur family transcriptional regulator [Leptolyngbya sp. PCC 6406]|uniref:Fur family transcriptional regulator n=1 Tax=Leptolyngbya sp. PCC 6406 TaxID=1173264 RepID=UPI0002ACFBF3|nr:Fur family transcriptional regulator [Leptolyngbya sp. PCC 6406]